MPGGWILRDETGPEASSSCFGPRDAAKPVSGAARSLAKKNHAADARQGIVSIPRHPGKLSGQLIIHSAPRVEGRRSRWPSVRPCLPWFRAAEASGLVAGYLN